MERYRDVAKPSSTRRGTSFLTLANPNPNPNPNPNHNHNHTLTPTHTLTPPHTLALPPCPDQVAAALQWHGQGVAGPALAGGLVQLWQQLVAEARP